MKITALILGVVSALSCATWQHRHLATLHAIEEALATESTALGAAGREQQVETNPGESGSSFMPGLSDEEFVRFADTVVARRRDFESNRFERLADQSSGNWKIPSALCEPLSRVSAAQLRSLLNELDGGSSLKYDSSTPAGRFLWLADRTNPAAAIQLIYQMAAENAERNFGAGVSVAFWFWFQQDPAGLLHWARAAGTPEGFDGACGLWVDAAETLLAPSVENVRRFLAHKGYHAEMAASQLAAQFPSAELRLQFFQSLHAASGGTLNIENYVGHLVARAPFAELAHLADTVPPFTPLTTLQSDPFERGEPAGSLRCEIAIHTRDGTAETRWQWLTQRPEDRPAGKLLARLVNEWCDHDFPDTAKWAKTLPPGPERDTARKAIAGFLSYNGAKDLAKEWDAG
jgi:hypothetical protein